MWQLDDVNLVALIVAVLGAGGIGATTREIVSALSKVFTGMSGREEARKNDIIEQRDLAIWERDIERRNRRLLEESLAEARRAQIEAGVPLANLPPWPVMESVVPPKSLRGGNKKMEEEDAD